MSARAGQPRTRAADPRASVFVAANAGSGKTSTLVDRVARLLLGGTPPQAILCVTFTKAAAAEMQTRLFRRLGEWAVMPDAPLAEALDRIGEQGRELSQARALFARALETPGGLKIQTLHAFCEKLLRRFPLEAGVGPAFTVLEGARAAEVVAGARRSLAELALDAPRHTVARAYARFAVALAYGDFEKMLGEFESRRGAIAAYLAACEEAGRTVDADVWARCGFDKPTSIEAVRAWALTRLRRRGWEGAVAALMASDKITDRKLGAAMRDARDCADFAKAWAAFCTAAGTPLARLGTSSISPAIRDWLAEEQARCREAQARIAAAVVAEDSCAALVLATAYAALYQGAKDARGALDFGDLITRTVELLTVRADAAWVLYKLDLGLEHVLLDEAQDTAPEQWDMLRALTGEFFHGAGAGAAGRTVFAVGDPKQSIFSFQGAAPERFAAEGDAFARAVDAAGRRFAHIPLLRSWRSRPEILGFVDAVFADEEALAGLRPRGATVKPFRLIHQPTRGPGGCVDLWPLTEKGPVVEADVWVPVDAQLTFSANRLLAGHIARAVAAMVREREAVADPSTDEMRACRYGDVMILVRRRGPLFDEIIRALKREGAPVAGSDRLELAAHGVFADLMALGRFLRFPGDDLALAGLLRSPLADVSEEELFDLAQGREGRLWTALRARAGERASWGEAARLLQWAGEEAARRPPFDFYCRLLARLDGAGRSMRQRILTRMSAEGEQALDAFLAQVLAAEGEGARDLESLLAWMAATDLDIKREQDEAAGEVRVMTVHGAKGLEAPVVILPDTTTRAAAQGGPLMETADGAFLWAPRKGEDCDASAAARAARDLAAEHESARLLYVALTRARDRLIVAGIESRLFERSWYDYVARAFAGLETRPIALPGGGEGRRWGPDPGRADVAAEAGAGDAPPPPWASRFAPREVVPAALVSPSRLAESDPGAAPSPLAEVGGLGRYRRGELIHRLLQLLPDLAPERRAEGAERLLAREAGLTDDQRAEMAAAALAVLEDARFAAVFAPGARAEVPLAGRAPGLPAGLTVSGRVDRLAVEAARVLVVDFKTNRPAPARIEDVEAAYIAQMAVYRALLIELYPDRPVEAALVWTDGPALMPVPAALMDQALRDLAG